jgi:hypothetical protein
METIWSCFFVSGCQIPHTQTAFTAPALFLSEWGWCRRTGRPSLATRSVAVLVAVPGVRVVEYVQGRHFPWSVVQDTPPALRRPRPSAGIL